MADYQFLPFKGLQIAYLDNQRTSDQLYIAFHGYADTAMQFLDLLQNCQSARFIAIELPYHGRSSAHDYLISPADICEIIRQIVGQHTVISRWHLVGFSMGARILLSMLPFIPCHLGKVILISPAGFTYSLSLSRRLFPLSIRTRLGRWLMEGEELPRFWALLFRFKMLSEQTYSIFKRQVQSKQKRKRMMYIWRLMYYFTNKINGKHWRYVYKSEKVVILCGTRDRVTPSKQIIRQVNNIKHVYIHEMEGDHFLLAKNGEEVCQFLVENEYL